MYRLSPIKVYVLDGADDNPAWAARMGRIVSALDPPPSEITRITKENLPEVVSELRRAWPPETVPLGRERTFMRPLIFTTMDLHDPPRDLAALAARCGEGAEGMIRDIYGQFQRVRPTHPREQDQQNNCVCWPTFDFGAMRGCPHGCLYCGEGKSGRYIVIPLNIEQYVEQVVGPEIERQPQQKCFRMIGWGADLIAFEPEYGLFDLFTRKLAQYEDHYGYFHTASTNVDWIADLPHKDRLIGVWTVTGDEVARLIEPGAAPAFERFEAGRRCLQMGVPARYKFKPIVPIRNWREDYARAIKQALQPPAPESIGLCVLMWMDYETLADKISIDLLDPDCAAAARDAAEKLKGVSTGPFPHRVRSEIYRFFIEQVRRHDKHIPLYVSTESREMWEELKDELGQDPRTYVCGCGPAAVPGGRLDLASDFRYSNFSPVPS